MKVQKQVEGWMVQWKFRKSQWFLMQAEEPGIRFAEESWEEMVANISNQA